MPESSSPTSVGNGPASFWAVDLHVHTPASLDVREQLDKYGATTPEEVVTAAIAAGLDAIAITDHNTTAWCEQVQRAVEGRSLVVLPGVEISTKDGHLLGIWEHGTPSVRIDEVLTRLDIGHEQRGRLDICASKGFAETAQIIAAPHPVTLCGSTRTVLSVDKVLPLSAAKVVHARRARLEQRPVS